MPEEFRIWQIDDDAAAYQLPGLPRMDTEKNLEDILTKNPELLGDGVALVGRQIGAGSGPLDLLGVTSDGKLVVYELKRGGTPREAITQALDYASALDGKSDEELAHDIQEHSGRDGIPEIDDFADWYADHSSIGDLSRRGRTAICCVGVGVDPATLRMAKWLREAGVDISIIEFAAYQHGNANLLARNVELDDDDRARTRPGGQGFDPRERARERNALSQFDRAVEIVRSCFREIQYDVYRHKNLLRFWLPDDSGDGTRQLNAVGVIVRSEAAGQVYIAISSRIAQRLHGEFEQMRAGFEAAGVAERSRIHPAWRRFRVSSVEEVEAVRPALEQFLAVIVARYGNSQS